MDLTDRRIIEMVRKLPGRPHYVSNKWVIRYGKHDWENAKIDTAVTKLEGKVRRLIQKDVQEAPEITGEIADLPPLDITLPIRRPLYGFQGYGVGYMKKHRRAICGDQPGLGKTAQAAALMLIGRVIPDTSTLPALIICPATIKRKWQRELMIVSGLRAMILTEKYKYKFPYLLQSGNIDAIIVNYESLHTYFCEPIVKGSAELRMSDIIFKAVKDLFKVVIIDESHRCKDYKTRQAKVVRGICEGKEWIMALTGTPVVNKPADLMAQLAIIGRINDFGGFKYFRERYCGGGKQATNLNELNYKLTQLCFYRREKKAVLKDLPDKTRQIVLCEIDNRLEYTEAENKFESYLRLFKNCTEAEVRRKMQAKFLTQLGILCEISARGKLAAVKEWIENLLACGEKVVIFCNLIDIIKRLKSLFPGSLEISGRIPTDERDRFVTLFQTNDKYKVMFCNIKAGGVAIDLFAAWNVGFIEFPWTPADCEQCEDRLHRNGQKNAVLANYFLGENTVDEFKYNKIQDKKDIADQVTGNEHDVEELVDTLLNVLSKHKKQRDDAYPES